MRALVLFSLVVTSFLFSGQAFSQLYIGATGGQTDTAPYRGAADLPAMEKDVGFRAFLGNRLSDKFSYEVAYVDLGSFEFSGRPDNVSDTLSITGFDVSVVAKIPLRRRLLLFARLGIFDWDGERQIVDSVALTQELFASSDTHHHMALGAEIRISKYLGITLEANQYRVADVANSLYGLGVFFTF